MQFLPAKEQWFSETAELSSTKLVKNRQELSHCTNLDIYGDRMYHPKQVQQA